jgi:hypothetical protein
MIRRYVQMADYAFRLRSLSYGGRGRLQSAYDRRAVCAVLAGLAIIIRFGASNSCESAYIS